MANRYIKTLVFLWVGLGAAQSAFAKPLTESGIRKVLKYYGSFKTLKTSFEQTKTLKDIGVNLNSSGRLTVVRPSRVVWQVLKPEKVLAVLDEKGFELTSGGEKQSFSLDRSKHTEIGALLAWLQLDAKKLFAHYEFTKVGKLEFRCKPKQKGAFSSIGMKLHRSGYLEELLLSESSGDLLQLKFSKPKIKR